MEGPTITQLVAARDALVVIYGEQREQVRTLDAQIDEARVARGATKPAWAVAKRILEKDGP